MTKTPAGAAIIDASLSVAVSAKEHGREPVANAELLRYSASDYRFYAPGVIVAETLYVLCGKLQRQVLTAAEHAQGLVDFETLMRRLESPPDGEVSLIARAEAIRLSYGCSRSADGIYIALAEALARVMPTVILTFDQDMHKQVIRNAPSVRVHTLAP